MEQAGVMEKHTESGVYMEGGGDTDLLQGLLRGCLACLISDSRRAVGWLRSGDSLQLTLIEPYCNGTVSPFFCGIILLGLQQRWDNTSL